MSKIVNPLFKNINIDEQEIIIITPQFGHQVQ